MSQDNIPSNEKLIADLKEVVRELWRAVDTHRHYDVYIQKLLDTPYAPVHQTSEQPIVQPPKHFDPKDSGWICPVCEGWNPLGRLQCQHPHAHETDDHRAAFKNFHRLLCERFGYGHDEVDWERDQLSLIEWIAKRPPSETLSDDPFLADRANGVHGVYCIARVINGTTEYWTGQKWAAFCNDLYFDLRPAQKAAQKAAVIHNPDCVKENARIDGRDRWYMLDCDCGTDKNG